MKSLFVRAIPAGSLVLSCTKQQTNFNPLIQTIYYSLIHAHFCYGRIVIVAGLVIMFLKFLSVHSNILRQGEWLETGTVKSFSRKNALNTKKIKEN